MKQAIKIKESKLRELVKKIILRETSYRNLAHMAVPGETDAELEKNWVGRTTAGMNMDDYGNNGDISGFMMPDAKKLKSKEAQNDASWDAYDEVAGITDLYRDNYKDFYDLDKNVNYDDDRSHANSYVNHDAYFVGDDPDPIAEAVKKSIKKVLNEKDAQEQLQESKLRAIIKEGIKKVLNEEYGVDIKDTLAWVQKKHPDMSPEEQERFAKNIIAKRQRTGKEKRYWLFSMEWNDDTPYASPNFPQYKLHLYPNITGSEMESIKSDANKYSPYDYLDFDEFDNEEEFNKKVQYMVSNGAIIN